MKVNEIFTSIQGEGPYSGRQATFLRLAGCNLHCPDCDSSYSWEEGGEASVGDVLHKLMGVVPAPYVTNEKINQQYIVVTGGEPLLQAKELGSVILTCPDSWMWGIETNGTIFDPTKAVIMRNIHFIISPKLSSMHPDGLEKLDKRWVSACKNTIWKVFFKFVVNTEEDVRELREFINKYKIPKNKVWIMPKATTREKHFNKWPHIFNIALRLGVNASPRLHIMARGNERGI